MMNFGFRERFFKNQKEKKKEPKSSKKRGVGRAQGWGGHYPVCLKKNEDTTFGRESLEEERRTLKKK